MFRNHSWRFASAIAALLAIPLVAAGCSGDPTGPMGPRMMLSDVKVMVDGQVMNGQTMQVGHGQNASTLFQAHLTDLDGAPVRNAQVRVSFDRPRGMKHMGNQHGEFRLYDDGTHGDPVAGDGIYCFEDWQGAYGCHAAGLGPGEYHYEFWGEHDDGHHSDHHEVMIHLLE